MQRLYPCPWTPEEYQATEAFRQIIAEPTCPICLKGSHLHRHGRYQRWFLTRPAKFMLLWVARFLCPLCRRTVSYLPDFVLSYRPIQPETFEAFISHQLDDPDVRSQRDRLRRYQLKAEAFAAELFGVIGSTFGRPPPELECGFWPWIKKAGEGLRPFTRRLVSDFGITLFKRYHCHQSAGP